VSLKARNHTTGPGPTGPIRDKQKRKGHHPRRDRGPKRKEQERWKIFVSRVLQEHTCERWTRAPIKSSYSLAIHMVSELETMMTDIQQKKKDEIRKIRNATLPGRRLILSTSVVAYARLTRRRE
jgi:hypothetical protein